MFDFLTKSLSGLFGSKAERDLKELRPIVDKVHAAHEPIKGLSNDQLRNKTAEFKKRIQDHISSEEKQVAELKAKAESLDTPVEEKEAIYASLDSLKKTINAKIQEVLNELMPEAFAVIKETAKRFKENAEVEVTASQHDRDYAAKKKNVRIDGTKAYWANTWEAAGSMVTWDMVHYDVQLIGGAVLHQGKISEMATGEGKTLVATLPIYLNALSGKGLHIVTVNNYLSRRDSEWMGPLFEFHGLRVDCIDMHEPNSWERRNAYLADVTYGTNNEFGFDYLRDNMTKSPEELVQREHFFAIVDEVDSVLIDDARTPLIISGPTPKGETHEFQEFRPKIEKIVSAQRTLINTVLADAKRLIGEGNEKDGGFALLRAYRGLPKNKALIKFLSEPGVKGILLKTENYYMADHNKEMPKIDEALYFVIDEKNQTVELTERGIDLMTSSTEDAKFFVMPDVGSEIAEIEKSTMSPAEKAQRKDVLMSDFAVKSERIHTVNQLLRAYTLFEKDVEYVVMDNKVKIVDEQTGRILDGRRYSDGLHQAIEAKENVKVEASTQTWATVTLQNYFRMYVKLAGMTGTAETEAGEFWDIYKLDVVVIPTNRKISRKDHEDLVYNTKREKYNAVIDEIVKLTDAGRPVLVGTTSVEISELLSRMLKMKGIRHNVLNAKLHQKEADIVAQAGHAGTVTIATNMAGRGTDIKLGPGVKEAGGLAIIGTERHDSRRVDRQLRGRAGRQGDPGSSQFFVSLEDDLMRLFGSERIQKLMGKMGFAEGEVIQHPMITRSIERAQKKVEENNFATRKRLLEYDDVMNSQREVVYSKRRHALFGERLSIDISNMIYDVSESLITEFHDLKDYEGLKLETIKKLALDLPFTEQEFSKSTVETLTQKMFEVASAEYKRRTEAIVANVYPVVKNVFETSAHIYENIVVPFSDGVDTIQVMCNLKQSYESGGREVLNAFEKSINLSIIDDSWKEHLRELDDLKQAVHNAVYEQKDPLLVYKFESFDLFKKMIDKINKDVVSFLFRAKLPQSQEQVKEAKAPAPAKEMQKLQTSRSEVPVPAEAMAGNAGGEDRPKPQPVRVEKTVGRNDPCPCGSGKKFKNCHGK